MKCFAPSRSCYLSLRTLVCKKETPGATLRAGSCRRVERTVLEGQAAHKPDWGWGHQRTRAVGLTPGAEGEGRKGLACHKHIPLEGKSLQRFASKADSTGPALSAPRPALALRRYPQPRPAGSSREGSNPLRLARKSTRTSRRSHRPPPEPGKLLLLF